MLVSLSNRYMSEKVFHSYVSLPEGKSVLKPHTHWFPVKIFHSYVSHNQMVYE